MEIAGVSAIVTGGASGLGAAAARMLVSAGAKVAIFDYDEAKGGALADSLPAKFLKTDVTSEHNVESSITAAEALHGTARILVNCAGIAPAVKTVSREFEPQPAEQFRRVIEINLIGSFSVLSRFAARLIREPSDAPERGVIINTASIAAFDGQIGHAAYAASKGGLVSFTLPIAREFARERIRVMTIAPGMFETPIVEGLPGQVQAAVSKQVLHPSRMGHPDEFAQLVEAIIRNPMLNGETIRLDGAVRLPPR